MKTLYAVWLIFVLLAGCAALGLEAPQTFNEKLAVGYSTVTAVRAAAATFVSSGKLSPDDAQNVQTQADTARAARIERVTSGNSKEFFKHSLAHVGRNTGPFIDDRDPREAVLAQSRSLG